MQPIVRTAEELSVDWFNEALAKDLDGAKVVAAHVEPVGTGQLARMVRAELSYDGAAGLPPSVVVKYPSADPRSLGFAQALDMYRLEVLFYRELSPLLPELSAPRCYLAEVDDTASGTGAFTLVLEDLSATTRPGDVLTRGTPEQCSAALEQVVHLQAPSWDNPEFTKRDWLAKPERTWALFDQLQGGLAPFLERFGTQLTEDQIRVCETIMPRAGEWARAWSGPQVLQHGDYRADNVMFGATDDGPPLTVIDFQLIRLGPSGFDPAYFLASSLSTEVRRESERDLIAEYHQRLVAAGVSGFDANRCWDAYRAGALYGVVMFCGAASQVESTERGDRMVVDQMTRYADMVLDLDSLALAGM